MATVNKVANSNNYVGALTIDSSASLPIGIYKQIGQATYIIAVDSARFLPAGASCSAYMAIALPGMADSIAFAAKNIGINPKGVLSGNVGSSRLLLVSNHRIKLSPKITMVLKNDGHNYVEWNCNGFQAINLKGYFEFSGTMLEPDSPITDSTVNASFEIHTNDIHNIVMVANITPFKIKGISDVSFSVTDAVADFSELANAPLMAFPNGYTLNDPNPLMWTGFFIRNCTVKLPQELSNKNQQRTTIQANNLIIDNTGITGNFAATNVLAAGNSNMSGWSFSIDQIGMSVVQNHIYSGSINGNINLPIFENNGLNYTANISENPTSKEVDYAFIVSPQNNINANVLSASIDIYNTSQISVTKVNHTLVPLALLNGQIKFNGSNLNTGKLDFQGLRIEKNSPYLTQGIFNYVSSTVNKSMNFPITINQIQLVLNQSNPNVYFNVGLNFMQATDQGFSANVGIRVKTKLISNPESAAYPKLSFDKVQVEDINLDINSQAFTLKGKVIHMEDNPVYGNAMAGTMTLTLPNINGLSVSFTSLFGAMPTYKYFYVDGSVIFPTAVNLTANVKLKGLIGGLYYHMHKNIDYVQTMQVANSGPVGTYIPDNTKSIGFKAGGTLYYNSEEAFNADMVLHVQFNSSQAGGGISTISFSGDAFSMISISGRQGKRYNQVPIGATGLITYDFNNKILHAILNMGINLSQTNANINSVMHFEPGLWYVSIGKPSNKGVVNLSNFGTVYAYFMTGTQIDPPVMPQPIAQHFGNPYSRSSTSLGNGTGFCMGAELSRSQNNEFGFSFFTVYGSIFYGVGFDVMMNKVSPAYICPNTGESPGFKGYYVNGSVYAYLGGYVGVKGNVTVLGKQKDFDFHVLSVSAYAMLYGQLVKPTYIEGSVYAEYTILSVVSGNFDFNFKTGNKCNG